MKGFVGDDVVTSKSIEGIVSHSHRAVVGQDKLGLLGHHCDMLSCDLGAQGDCGVNLNA